jgi:hypothetical protein
LYSGGYSPAGRQARWSAASVFFSSGTKGTGLVSREGNAFRDARSPWADKRVVEKCGAVELVDGVTLLGGRAVGLRFPGLSWWIQRPSRN